MIMCGKMNDTESSFVSVGSRWLGIAFATVLASLSWYCLLYGIAGAAVFSLFAIALLFLALFSPQRLAMPVRLALRLLEKAYVGLLYVGLLLVFFLILTPMGLLASVFGSKFLSQEYIQRSRKYKNKSPGSYWSNATGRQP